MAKKTGKAAQRRAREAAARAAVARARKRQQWTITVAGIAVVVVLAAVVTAVILVNRNGSPAAAPTAVPKTPATTATGRTSSPPWAVPADATAAVNAAGLPMLGSEGTVEHIHAHLDIYADGKQVTVPADIGIDVQAEKISPLHTHDTTGVIHIESPTKATFTLGQFFTEWRVSLSANHIGGLKVTGGTQLRAYVNGKRRSGDPAAIVLHAHDEIALVYGTAAQQKNPPSTYNFPSGE